MLSGCHPATLRVGYRNEFSSPEETLQTQKKIKVARYLTVAKSHLVLCIFTVAYY
jgi:hypothetical protein